MINTIRFALVLCAVTFVASAFWFAYIADWKFALWCMGAALVTIMLPIILAKPEP